MLIQVGFWIGFPCYRLTIVSVNDSVNDLVSNTVTKLVYYPFFYVFIEALEPYLIDSLPYLDLQSVHGLPIDNIFLQFYIYIFCLGAYTNLILYYK